MATSQEEKDKEMERKTAIIGDMPNRSDYETEKAKWDSKGNLIDPDEIAKEQRERDVLLGKVPPTIEDYHDQDFGNRILGTVETNQSIQNDQVNNPAGSTVPDPPPTVPDNPPDSLAGLTPETIPVPGTDSASADLSGSDPGNLADPAGTDPATETANTSKKK